MQKEEKIFIFYWISLRPKDLKVFYQTPKRCFQSPINQTQAWKNGNCVNSGAQTYNNQFLVRGKSAKNVKSLSPKMHFLISSFNPLSLSPPLSFSFSLSFLLSHSRSHTLLLSHSLAHTLSSSHTLPLSHSLAFTLSCSHTLALTLSCSHDIMPSFFHLCQFYHSTAHSHSLSLFLFLFLFLSLSSLGFSILLSHTFSLT